MRLNFRYRNWIIGVSIVATLLGLYTIRKLYAWYLHEFPEVSRLNVEYPHVHYHGPKTHFTVTLSKSPPATWVRLNQISPVAVAAIVMSEDSAFYQHDGIDVDQLKDAIREDLKKGKFKRGGSTITMQVVKNVFLTSEKTFYRKGKEILLAMELNDRVPKKRVLEAYLNIAEWGEGTFGIQSASLLYFKKPASALTAKEGAFLAMLLPSPKRYSQSYRSHRLTRYATTIIDSILGKLAQVGRITEETRASESARPLSFETSTLGSPPPAGDEEGGDADDDADEADTPAADADNMDDAAEATPPEPALDRAAQDPR